MRPRLLFRAIANAEQDVRRQFSSHDSACKAIKSAPTAAIVCVNPQYGWDAPSHPCHACWIRSGR
jgi:hypothetical protein